MTNSLTDRMLARSPEATNYFSDMWVDDLEMIIDDPEMLRSLAARFDTSPAHIARLAQYFIPLATA